MKSLVLPMVLLVTVSTVGFSQISSGDWTYTLNASDEATIVGYGGAGGAVNIPSSIDGKVVKQVGTSFTPVFSYGNTTVTSVTIPETVTTIGFNAFAGCTALVDILIPDSVKFIHALAFIDCTALTSVTIGSGLTDIGSQAFGNCDSLKELYFLGDAPPSVSYPLFHNIELPGTVYYRQGTAGWQSTFETWPTQELSIGQMVNAISSNRYNRGQTDVTTKPSAFNLFTKQQFDSNRTAGQSDVINNPLSYGLYDSNSIMDLRMGGLMIQKQGTNAAVSFQPQTTTDLTQPFTNNGTPIISTIPMPGNKGFIRINAKP